jgi:hypothetical protein
MTEISYPIREPSPLSPRTANYIAALSREGEKFDYSRWLETVRKEEAKAKKVPATFPSGAVVAAEVGTISSSDYPDGQPNSHRHCWPQWHRPPEQYSGHIAHPKAKHQNSAFGPGLRRSVMRGTTFRQVGTATPCMDTWGRYLQSSRITKFVEGPTDFFDMRSTSLAFHLTTKRTRLLPSFAARVTTLSIARRSANGRERCGTSLIARSAGRR